MFVQIVLLQYGVTTEGLTAVDGLTAGVWRMRRVFLHVVSRKAGSCSGKGRSVSCNQSPRIEYSPTLSPPCFLTVLVVDVRGGSLGIALGRCPYMDRVPSFQVLPCDCTWDRRGRQATPLT